MEILNSLFGELSSGLVSFLISVVELLPDSPFLFLEEVKAPASIVMSYVNWFIDFPRILEITIAWCLGGAGWGTYRMIFKWAKMAG